MQIGPEESRFYAVRCSRDSYLNECDLRRLKEEKCLYKKFAGGDLGILPDLCQALELPYNFLQTQQKAYHWQLSNANLSHSKMGEWLGKSHSPELEQDIQERTRKFPCLLFNTVVLH